MNYLYQLNGILKASGWSQEQLARELGVSFPALNAWLNKRSRPRQKALVNIEKLYLNIVGTGTVDQKEFKRAKKIASSLKMSAKNLTGNKEALDKLTLYLTYHTNTIEGSTMTLSDVQEVIFEHKSLSNRTAIEQAEARNHQAALLWLLEQLVEAGSRFRIDEKLIFGIHLRLMNGIKSDAGQYRKHSVRIMGAHVPLANWQKVPELMKDFTEKLNRTSGNLIAELAMTHAIFEQIHPFSDGNGRTGRLLLLAQALQAGLTPPLIVKERRFAYYKYLEIAQTRQNYEPLELFLAQSMQFCQQLLTETK